MTYIYAIEGDIVVWFQHTLEHPILTSVLTHFYVAGYMMIIFSAFVYTCYFDDRHMADRISLTILLTYLIALPFYLFFNVRVTGDFIRNGIFGYHLTLRFRHGLLESIHLPMACRVCILESHLPFGTAMREMIWMGVGKFEILMIAYTSLTAFTILYLGIHWVDIIGGIAVGMLSVHVFERIAPRVWWLLDERPSYIVSRGS